MDKPLIPIEALEGVMIKAFLEKTIPTGLFWDALLKANLYIPLRKDEKPRERQEGEETKKEYPMLLGLNEEGENVVWLFTSPAVLIDYVEQELPYLESSSVAIFSSIKESEHEIFLIGPEGLTLSLHPELIDSMSEGKVPESGPEETLLDVPKDAEIRVSAPVDPTEELEKRFLLLFKSLPEVLEASFIQIADGIGSRLLLGVRLEKESREILKEVAQKVAKVSEGALDKGKTFDITLMGGSLKGAFEKWGKTFFKK